MGTWLIEIYFYCGTCKALLQNVTREWAENYAGILDGTSPYYVYPPGPDSVIGQCQECGGRFAARAKAASGEVPVQ